MTPSLSLSECATQVNRALGMRDFSGAQMWLDEYRHQFDRSIQGLAPHEVLQLLAPAMDSMKSALYAALATRSYIAADIADIVRTAPYRKLETRHAWELQG